MLEKENQKCMMEEYPEWIYDIYQEGVEVSKKEKIINNIAEFATNVDFPRIFAMVLCTKLKISRSYIPDSSIYDVADHIARKLSFEEPKTKKELFLNAMLGRGALAGIACNSLAAIYEDDGISNIIETIQLFSKKDSIKLKTRILLYGPAGTGKTSVANFLMSGGSYTASSVKIDHRVGEHGNISILSLDDIHHEKNKRELLRVLDTWNGVVICTSNKDPKDIDNEIFRAGRIDVILKVDYWYKRESALEYLRSVKFNSAESEKILTLFESLNGKEYYQPSAVASFANHIRTEITIRGIQKKFSDSTKNALSTL